MRIEWHNLFSEVAGWAIVIGIPLYCLVAVINDQRRSRVETDAARRRERGL